MSGVDQASRLRKLIENTHGTPQQNARVIAVASGKGGTGKSVLSVNLAVALKRLGQRVLLVDCDFGLANVDLMLGVSAKYNLSHVIAGEIGMAEAVQEGVEGVRFLSGGSGVETLINLEQSAVLRLMDDLLQLESDADIILLDTGAGVSDTVLKLILSGQECIVVTTPEPTAMMDAYALIKRLNTVGTRLPAMRLVVNRTQNAKEAQDTLGAIPSLSMRFMNLVIEPLGSISYDASVPDAIKRQVPLLLSHPRSQASRDIQSIARSCLGLPPTGRRAGLSAFLQRLTSKEGAPS